MNVARLVAVLGVASLFAGTWAFQVNPNGGTGIQDPKAQVFTEKQLEAQQAMPHVAAPVNSSRPEELPQSADVPSSTTGAGRLADARQRDRAPEETARGLQVLREAQHTVDSQSRGPWPVAIGLVVFGAAGFGAVAVVRTWASKNAPPQPQPPV